MAVYMVSYDLNSPGQKYQNLYDALESYSSYWHCLDSTWLIKTDDRPTQILDHLASALDKNDTLLVAKVSAPAAAEGLSKDCSDWLENHLGG